MIKKIVFTVSLLVVLFTAKCFAREDFDGYIVNLKSSGEVSLFSATDTAVTDSLEPVVPEQNIYKVESLEELQELTDKGLVEYAEPDYTVTLSGDIFVPEDKYFSSTYQYGIEMIKMDYAWDMGIFGNEIKVGVIDSGIYPHNELIDNTLPGYNYTVEEEVCDKGRTCTDTTCSHYDYEDTYGHGSFVSGIIAAQANSTHIIGATPAAKIVPLRSFIENSGSISNIVSAIYDAVDKFDCDVINMSFGLYNYSVNLATAVAHAVNNNVLVVAAAGNDNATNRVYPGSLNGVVCVGSVDSEGNKSSFSNHSPYVDLSAPGTGIYSCTISGPNGLGCSSGTSFSTPYTASAAAICKMLNPDITNAEFEALLKETVTPYAEDFSYNLGTGILNIENLVLILLEYEDMYYSPINRFYDKTFRMITNLTTIDQSFANLWRGENTFACNNVTLPSFGTYMSEFEEYGSATNFIWDGITSLKPVNKADFLLN